MYGIERLRAWWSGAGQADMPAAEKEIDEELMFHLRSLVEDNLAGIAGRNRLARGPAAVWFAAALCRGLPRQNRPAPLCPDGGGGGPAVVNRGVRLVAA